MQIIIIKNDHDFLKITKERPQIVFLTLSLKMYLFHFNIKSNITKLELRNLNLQCCPFVGRRQFLL